MFEKVGRGWARLGAWNRRRPKLPAWACILVLVALTLLVEVFVFNFRYWQSLGYEEIVLRDTPVEVTKEGYSLGFSSLDVEAHNVRVEVENSSELDSSVWVQVAVTDEGNSTSYYLPVTQGHEDNERSLVHTIFTYGKLKSLKISFPGDVYGGVDGQTLVASNDFPLTVTKVSINAQVPFTFSWLRVVLLLGGLLIAWGLRPGGVCSRIHALDPGVPARLVRGGVLAAMLVACVVFAVSFPRWFNVATTFYNSEDYNESGKLPWTTLNQPDTATNEYAKLAQAFAAGQLELLQTPPSWLVEMDDPYDYGARSEESSQHLRGYLWDTAYYDGSYYVYFGVLPVLVFYLPYYLITGSTFPNAVAVLVCSLAFVAGVYVLLRSLIRWRFTKASLATFVLVLLGVVCASGVIFGLARPGMYNVPVTMARALVAWGLCLWYRGWHRRSPVELGAGSLLVALIAATRPQLLIVAPLVVVLLVLVARTPRPAPLPAPARSLPARSPLVPEGIVVVEAPASLPVAAGVADLGVRAGTRAAGGTAAAGGPSALTLRQKVGWFACLLVPFVVVGAGVMWYNWARFDSPFDFGASYNLTYNNMTMRGHSLIRALEGLYYYLLNPVSVTTNFPFLQLGAIYPTFSGTTIYEPLFGGLLLLEPMLLAVAFVGGLRRDRGVGRADKPLFWMAGYFLAAGVILVLFDTEGAGILLRYVQDFGFLFALSAALVFLHHLGGAGTRGPEEGVWAPGELEAAEGRPCEVAPAVIPCVAEAGRPDAGEVQADAGGPAGGGPAGAGEVEAAPSGCEAGAGEVESAGGGPAGAGEVGEGADADEAVLGGCETGATPPDATTEPADASETPSPAVVPAQGVRTQTRRGPSGWALALFACVLVAYLTAILMGLLEHDPTGDLSVGGSNPLQWENLRQTFMWWL